MPKTANEELFDALLRHQIYLLRYSGHVRGRIATILNSTESEMSDRIRARLENSVGSIEGAEWRRLQALLSVLERIRMNAWRDVETFLTDEMIALAAEEARNLSRVLATTAPVQMSTVLPSATMLRSIAISRPFEGRLLRDWVSTMAQDDLRRISAAIQSGMVSGESAAAIARRVVGTGSLLGVDGVTEISRRQVQTIVRTAVQHIANNARDSFYKENADIVLEEEFVATLDSRTTAICRAMDGKIFKRGKGPQPPLHFSCRSLRVAYMDSDLVSLRPAKPYTEKTLLAEYAEANNLGTITSREDLPRGSKTPYDNWARTRMRQLIGQVPSNVTYETWLRGQSLAFQNDVLGTTKATLFRNGGLKLDRFVNRNGDELTLAELARKHSDAFIAAGLDPTDY